MAVYFLWLSALTLDFSWRIYHKNKGLMRYKYSWAWSSIRQSHNSAAPRATNSHLTHRGPVSTERTAPFTRHLETHTHTHSLSHTHTLTQTHVFFTHTAVFAVLQITSRLEAWGTVSTSTCWSLAHVRQNWRGGKEALLRCPAGKVHCYREKKPREMLLYWPFDQMTRQLLTRQASLTSLFLEETCKLKWLVSAK